MRELSHGAEIFRRGRRLPLFYNDAATRGPRQFFDGIPLNLATIPLALTPALVVDDDTNARRRLAHVLRTLGADDAELAFAADAAEADRRMQERRFALALIDIELPDVSGIELIRTWHGREDAPAAVIVSTFGTQDLILSALQAGAIGYLLKERDDDELAAALHSIRGGGAPIDPFVARHILRLVAQTHGSTSASAASATDALAEPLTRREEEILQFVAQGLTSREIAGQLSRSTSTVESHVKNIFAKLQVSTRTQAVHQARTLGLLH
ncbi:MAG: response regulator transcription factor [Rudaea sp.]|uniref:response regulator transcription factor n=1 Tax=Rudaea sp. 3F27F6 TaxID=2502208 RepID=UPI0010F46A98|nr:response regulator transcription factor [Rudaea sp. 3F27F6]MBN8884640.1 response regulator transcription factor [Rudaea sp.]